MERIIYQDASRTLTLQGERMMVAKGQKGQIQVDLGSAKMLETLPAATAAKLPEQGAGLFGLTAPNGTMLLILPNITIKAVKEAIGAAEATVAANKSAAASRRKAEQAHDDLINESGEGFNPHRDGSGGDLQDRTPWQKGDNDQ